MRCLILLPFLFLSGCAITQDAPRNTPADRTPAPSSPLVLQGFSTLVTREAPDFTAEAVMPDRSFKEITLSMYRGKHVVLFFYPLDFTVVCPTEIMAFEERLDDFKQNGCEVIGVSTDSKYTHLAWRNTSRENGGIGKISYPLVSDATRRIAQSYGVLHDESVALRGLFIIDPKGRVRHALVNDLPVGRSIDEALRTLEAIQAADQEGVFCPANWRPGDPTLKKAEKSMQDYFKKKSS